MRTSIPRFNSVIKIGFKRIGEQSIQMKGPLNQLTAAPANGQEGLAQASNSTSKEKRSLQM